MADRLLEADLVDTAGLVALPPLPPLPPEEASGWVTLAGGAAVLLGRALWELAASVQAMACNTDVCWRWQHGVLDACVGWCARACDDATDGLCAAALCVVLAAGGVLGSVCRALNGTVDLIVLPASHCNTVLFLCASCFALPCVRVYRTRCGLQLRRWRPHAASTENCPRYWTQW